MQHKTSLMWFGPISKGFSLKITSPLFTSRVATTCRPNLKKKKFSRIYNLYTYFQILTHRFFWFPSIVCCHFYFSCKASRNLFDPQIPSKISVIWSKWPLTPNLFFCSNPKLAILTIFISETWEDVRLGQHQQKEIRVVMNRILSDTLYLMLKCCGFLDEVVNKIQFINFKFLLFYPLMYGRQGATVCFIYADYNFLYL